MGCFATGIIAGVPHAGALLAQDVPIAGDDEQPDPAQVQDEVGKRTEPEGEVATEEADRPGGPAYIAPENRDADSIYRQVFGKERPLTPAGDYSVIVDNINVGEYRMDPERDGGSVDARLLAAACACGRAARAVRAVVHGRQRVQPAALQAQQVVRRL